MILEDLLRGINVRRVLGPRDAEIDGISIDSKSVTKGDLFVAIKGAKSDGHNYIDSAISKGASAVLVEDVPDQLNKGIPVIEVADTRMGLADISANFYNHPTKDLVLVGITGTNGKTTVTYLLESIWAYEGLSPGVVGTIDYRYKGKTTASNMTTPESHDLMETLSTMRHSGVSHVAMEVSSHALDKDRVRGCEFDVAVYTNLSQDHLDYHKSIEDYFDAKKKLFTEVLPQSSKSMLCSVINLDDEYGERLSKEARGEIVLYSVENSNANFYAKKINISEKGISAIIKTPGDNITINSGLLGKHNLSNILAAVATAYSLGVSSDTIEKGINELKSVPGRLEAIQNPFGFTILVDYAHTPDALSNVLRALRSFTKGRIVTVFGCGGDRDKTKRPLMGEIGRELSDLLIVTSDNPRTEDPEKIIDDIEKGVFGVDDSKENYYRISDRRSSIKKALDIAREHDTVLIAGKGHEDYQIVGTTKHSFDDREVAREILREKLN